MKHTLLMLIRAYQRTISPDHSPRGKARHPFGYCKYTPSCSAYAYEAIDQLGVVRGAVRTVWRVVRCNPWSSGGYDPVSPHAHQ